MIYNATFQEYLRALSVEKRVQALRNYGYQVEFRRFRKGNKSFHLFSTYTLRRSSETRIAISSPRGRYFYCYCVILKTVVA